MREIKRTRLLLTFIGTMCFVVSLLAQKSTQTLGYYIANAVQNSPLIQDAYHQDKILDYEQQRLKALYTRSKVALSGEYLFMPVIATDKGETSFKWNANEAHNYYGYDLGEINGHLHTGVTWRKPLLGNYNYKVAKQQKKIDQSILRNTIHLKSHELKRAVTEQYVLCLLDQTQVQFTKAITSLLAQQMVTLRKLADHGLVKQSDVQLFHIAQSQNEELALAAQQAFYTHLLDLNVLCGLQDTSHVALEEIHLKPQLAATPKALAFFEQYRLDSLKVLASLQAFKVQYKPTLHLFVDGGLRTAGYNSMYKHFGMSAGLTFSCLLYDGKQKQSMEQQTQLKMQTIATYKNDFILQRELRRQQYLTDIHTYDKRVKLLCQQLDEYSQVLAKYQLELQQGQISVLDYLTTFREKLKLENKYRLLKTNQQLLINSFNYWNWS